MTIQGIFIVQDSQTSTDQFSHWKEGEREREGDREREIFLASRLALQVPIFDEQSTAEHSRAAPFKL